MKYFFTFGEYFEKCLNLDTLRNANYQPLESVWAEWISLSRNQLARPGTDGYTMHYIARGIEWKCMYRPGTF